MLLRVPPRKSPDIQEPPLGGYHPLGPNSKRQVPLAAMRTTQAPDKPRQLRVPPRMLPAAEHSLERVPPRSGIQCSAAGPA